MAENRTKEIFVINFVAMVLNVILNLWLIRRLGLIGAALATLVAYSVAPLWMLIRGRKGGRSDTGASLESSEISLNAPIVSLEKV
jgi:Na+-driven multidrug efflux pump